MKNASDLEMECLLLQVGGKWLAIELQYIQRVEAYRNPVPLPFSPAYYLGVVAVQGQVVPLFSLSSYLSWPKENPRNNLLLASADGKFLISVDCIEANIKVSEHALQGCKYPVFSAQFEYQKRTVFLLDCTALGQLMMAKSASPLHFQACPRQDNTLKKVENWLDYFIFQRGERYLAIPLEDLDRVAEVKTFRQIDYVAKNVVGLTVIDDQAFFLCQRGDQERRVKKQLAIVPSYGGGGFAFLIDNIGKVSVRENQVITDNLGQVYIVRCGKKYNINNELRSEAKALQEALGEPHKALCGIKIREKSESYDFLLFKQNDVLFAIEFRHVFRVVFSSEQLLLPPHKVLKGLIALENEVVPIAELLPHFTIKSTEFIVVRATQGLLALASESMVGVRSVFKEKVSYSHVPCGSPIGAWFMENNDVVTVIDPLKIRLS